MFITSNKNGFLIHFNGMDFEDLVLAGGNIRIELSFDKARELKDRLEEALKEGK